MTSVVSVEKLTKEFLRRPAGTLTDVREELAGVFPRLFPGARRGETPAAEKISALREVSFELERGDRVALIGRNGAGKSTLLALLGRITAPSSGRVVFRGRVSVHLGVGAGFHPELSGRENVFLNGAFFGYTAREIRRHFDEIAEFAGIGDVLDLPVKRYSSGMRVRLAFALASHLDPDVLAVDEFLSLGDLEFREKCRARVEKLAESGTTFLLAANEPSVVDGICNRVIRLEGGRIVDDSRDVKAAFGAYRAAAGIG